MIAIGVAYLLGFVIDLPPWSIFAGFLVGLLVAGILYHKKIPPHVQTPFLMTEKMNIFCIFASLKETKA